MTSQTSHLNDHRGWQQITTFLKYFILIYSRDPAQPIAATIPRGVPPCY